MQSLAERKHHHPKALTESGHPTLRHMAFSSPKLGQALKSFQGRNCTVLGAGLILALWVRWAQAAPTQNPPATSPHPGLPKHFVDTLADSVQLN